MIVIDVIVIAKIDQNWSLIDRSSNKSIKNLFPIARSSINRSFFSKTDRLIADRLIEKVKNDRLIVDRLIEKIRNDRDRAIFSINDRSIINQSIIYFKNWSIDRSINRSASITDRPINDRETCHRIYLFIYMFSYKIEKIQTSGKH